MKIKLLFPLVLFTFYSCDGTDGLFGHSQTKEEAKANGSTVVEYLPNKKVFNLLDKTVMSVDTAWTELSFSYKNGKRILDSGYGYGFGIPYETKDPNKFTFIFTLADTTNRMFTNGRERDVCILHPKQLFDTIKVLLEQKDTDTSKGWMHPIITDTILFVKIK